MKFKQLREKLEGKALEKEMNPAPMLILRRRGVRIFPDGQRVALYTNDKYNLVFTVPFGSKSPSQPIIGSHPTNEAYVNVMPGVGAALIRYLKAKLADRKNSKKSSRNNQPKPKP